MNGEAGKTDLSNANKAEKENAFSVNLYHKMIGEVEDYAIILLNLDGTILNWNRGAEKIKGYQEDEIIGKNFRIFYLDSDRKDKLPERLISQAIENGRAAHEGWRLRKDGTRFWGSITITALHDSEQAVYGFVKVTRDLSERKFAEDAAIQYAANLEIRNRELEQFVYFASHDLQEPMRKIQTFIQLLETDPDAETGKKYLEKITSSAQRMTSLIGGILNYSRLTHYDEKFVPVDLNEVLDQVKTDFDLAFNEKKVIIKSDPLPVISGMPLQMNQLFSNIISNSLKFARESPVIRITCRRISPEVMGGISGISHKNDYAELIFEDNGIGFDPQYADQIFSMFRRLHSQKDYPGTGIGLALCKKIIDNHHGFIRAKGDPEKGASFYIYLPLEK